MSVLPTGVCGGNDPTPYDIEQSLRFRSSVSAYLSRTPGSSGNRNTWTWSGWVKLGFIETYSEIFACQTGTSGVLRDAIYYNASGQFGISGTNADNTTAFICTSVGTHRDPSAHYHLVVIYDSTQSTSTNRVRMYVNGSQVGFSTATYPALNHSTAINSSSVVHYIGRNGTGAYYLDGYLSEINFIDGQALDSSYFGETNADGVWVPKKYTGTYGTNGFYLPFNDGSDLTNLCLDRSGNGNNWTATNVSLTAGATYDWMDDTPTNNYAVLNPNARYLTTIAASNGNLTATKSSASDQPRVFGTIGVSSGKWYWEATPTAFTGPGNFYLLIGVGSGNMTSTYDPDMVAYIGTNDSGLAGYKSIRTGGSSSMTAYGANYTANDVIGVALDCDTNTITFYKNNVSQGAITSIQARLWFPFHHYDGSSTTGTVQFNFGQRPFAYTPPTGYQALCTANLPDVTITKPSNHFDVVLDTGANIKTTAQALFTDELVWIKDRANVDNHQLMDSVRGFDTVLQSNTTTAETAYSAPSGNSVGWAWKANGTGVTNTDGSITSTVSANTTAGFSIVTYTGTGANATVGHGLGVAPKMMIVKDRDGTRNWPVYHETVGGTGYLELNTTTTTLTNATMWNNTAPTSSVFSLGTGVLGNDATAGGYIAYCFAEVPGFSKFGSYTGKGSADGPFVYCGFRPKFVMVKMSSSTGSWVMLDADREGYNVDNDPLYANTTAAEGTTDLIDILSNGFKIRSTDASVNTSSGTYVYMAFAEHPVGGANVAPSPAR